MRIIVSRVVFDFKPWLMWSKPSQPISFPAMHNVSQTLKTQYYASKGIAPYLPSKETSAQRSLSTLHQGGVHRCADLIDCAINFQVALN